MLRILVVATTAIGVAGPVLAHHCFGRFNPGETIEVERFTLDPATMSLKRNYIAEDSAYFTDQYTGSDIVKPADAPFAVDECRELTYVDYSEATQG
jgi:hypothetical protein